MATSDKTRELAKAAKNADWQQVVLNGGPPCFHLEGKRFCLRAQRWEGHDSEHKFIPLVALLDAFERETKLAQHSSDCPVCLQFELGGIVKQTCLIRAALAQPTPEVKK